MRKVVLGLGISLDGYIARQNGAVDWLSMDWDYDWTAFFKTIDVVLMGAKNVGRGARNESETGVRKEIESGKPVRRDGNLRFLENFKGKRRGRRRGSFGKPEGIYRRPESERRQKYMAFGRRRAGKKLSRRKFGGRNLSRRDAASARLGLAAFSRADSRSSSQVHILQRLPSQKRRQRDARTRLRSEKIEKSGKWQVAVENCGARENRSERLKIRTCR
jgi:hypothetical protein